MLGGLIEKISASLGKSFLFAGLLPAAVLLAVSSLYWFGIADTWTQIQSVANAGDNAKSITWLALAWIVTGFILFAIRAWIFAVFRVMPTGRFGSWLLRRALSKRQRVQRELKRVEWQYTIAKWHERNFSPATAIYRPIWFDVPRIATALTKSKKARARLRKRAQVKTDGLPTWDDRCILIDGLTHLFAIITDAGTYQGHQQAIDDEVAQWVAETAQPGAKTFLEHFTEDIYREWTAAFDWNLHYAKGIWVYPTVIGNRLAALDDYAERRYGITTDTIWDRIWWVLPSAAKQEVSDARLAVEIATNLCAVFLLAAAEIATAEIGRNLHLATKAATDKPLLSVILVAGSIILAIIAYRGAIFAFDALAGKMRSLIDLYRLQLIAALGFHAKTVGEEYELLAELDHFFVQAAPRKPERELKIAISSEGAKDKSASDDHKPEKEAAKKVGDAGAAE